MIDHLNDVHVLEEREDAHLFEEAIDELAASAELLSASVDRSPKSQPHQCAERSRLPAITSARSSVHLILSAVHLLPVTADCITPKFPFFKVSVHLPKPKFPLKTVDTDCFRSKFPLLEVNVHLRKPKFHLNKVNASFAHPNADEIKEKFRQIKVNAGPAVRLAAPSRPPSAPPIPFAGLPLAPIAPRAAPLAPRDTVALPLLAVSASAPPSAPSRGERARAGARVRAVAYDVEVVPISTKHVTRENLDKLGRSIAMGRRRIVHGSIDESLTEDELIQLADRYPDASQLLQYAAMHPRARARGLRAIVAIALARDDVPTLSGVVTLQKAPIDVLRKLRRHESVSVRERELETRARDFPIEKLDLGAQGYGS